MAKEDFEDFSCPSQPQARHANKFDFMHSVVPSVAVENYRQVVTSLAEINDVAIATPCGTLLASQIEKCFLDRVGQQKNLSMPQDILISDP